MNGRLLLDTNIIIAIFKSDSSIITRVAKAEEVFISITVFGELFYGAYKSGQGGKNLKKIIILSSFIPVLNNDLNTAKEYGVIKNLLRKRGTPLPENDIWIAAIAKQYNLVLLTRDKHFTEIENLKLDLL